MATTARLGIDIVGRDRTRAAFGSAERSLRSLNSQARNTRALFGGGLLGFGIQNFIRSLIQINRNVPEVASSFAEMEDAYTSFAREVGEGGLNQAIIEITHSTAEWMHANQGLAASIGSFIANEMSAFRTGIANTKREFGALFRLFTEQASVREEMAGDFSGFGGGVQRGVGEVEEIGTAVSNTAAKADQLYVPAVRRAARATHEFRDSVEVFTPVMDDLGQQFADEWAGHFSNAITSVVQGTESIKDAIKGMVDSILEELTRLAVHKLFASLFNAGAGFLGGLGATTPGVGPGGMGFLHFGGPRQHGGGVERGKFYTVGEKGPELLMAGADGHVIPMGGGGRNDVQINIYNGSGEKVETRTRQQGGRRVEDIMIGQAVSAIASGRADRVLGQRFGLRPQLTQR